MLNTYLNKGFSIIPCGQNKIPLVEWTRYQTERASEETIRQWFDTDFPHASVGIVTGPISDLTVVDIDSEAAYNALISQYPVPRGYAHPTVKTPRGHHWYFRYESDIITRSDIMPNVDTRSKGGLVMAPPSPGYEWVNSFHTISFMPPELRSALAPPPETRNKYSHDFTQGNRDESIFHTANLLARGGASEEEIINIVLTMAKACDPPFPENEALLKVKSALNRHPYEEPMIEETELKKINIAAQPEDAEPIVFPLNLDDGINIYPGNIIIIAGERNSGKTAFLMNCAIMNMEKYNVSFFSSEAGQTEMGIRFRKFVDHNINEIASRVDVYERSSNFAEVIRPGAGNLNIIDFLEVYDNFFLVGKWIADIHKKLEGAICIIAIQKNSDKKFGLGNELSLDKARLYFTLSPGRIKYAKVKAFSRIDNPQGKEVSFKIVDGCKLINNNELPLQQLTIGDRRNEIPF